MKIAFWNVGGMGNVGDKVNVCTQWVRNNDPDILVFEEVSAALEDTLALPGLDKEHWIETLDRNGARSTKDLAVFAKPGVLSLVDDVRTPYLKTIQAEREAAARVVVDPRRDLARAGFRHQGVAYLIYGLHANASYSGGDTSVACMDRLISRNPGLNLICGGDFNSPRERYVAVTTKKVVPKRFDGEDMPFTQWDKDLRPAEFTRHLPDFDRAAFGRYVARLGLGGHEDWLARWIRCVLPHDLIDYVLCSPGVAITAEPCCADAAEWFDVLKTFDHAPVLYSL